MEMVQVTLLRRTLVSST